MYCLILLQLHQSDLFKENFPKLHVSNFLHNFQISHFKILIKSPRPSSSPPQVEETVAVLPGQFANLNILRAGGPTCGIRPLLCQPFVVYRPPQRMQESNPGPALLQLLSSSG